MYKCQVCHNEINNVPYIGEERMFGMGDQFQYFKCSNCGCLQIASIPENLDKYYPENYYSYSYDSTPHSLKARIADGLLKHALAVRLGHWDVIGSLAQIYNPYYKKAYAQHLGEEKFEWIFMPTPPITLSSFIRYVKQRSGAGFYLILRDIHPQSAWSIGLIKYRWMFRYLDRKARIGYSTADVIGCMSKANISYVDSLYPGLKIGRLELLYNWQKYTENSNVNYEVREKYGLTDKILALFGGTIGMGQRVENIVSLASHSRNNKKLMFVIIGKGVAKDKLSRLVAENNLNNVLILDFMPRNDYLSFVNSVDIGLISINENYKVPTCPSKAVSYMALGIPIFAMINKGNDYGSIIENDAGAGYCTEGGNSIDFEKFDRMVDNEELRRSMGAKGYSFYKEYLTSKVAYNSIMRQISE